MGDQEGIVEGEWEGEGSYADSPGHGQMVSFNDQGRIP